MGNINVLYHEHALNNIDHTIKCVNEVWFKDIQDKDRVYVYLKSYPNDKILTGKYYQNCGHIYGDKRDEWLSEIDKKDWKRPIGDEIWEVQIMTLKDLKELLLKEKGMQIILNEKYPGIII